MVVRIQPYYFNAYPESTSFQDDRMKDGVTAFLGRYFQRKVEPDLRLLKGGHSDSKNYLIEVDRVPYVLRVQDPKASLKHKQREMFAFQEAAKAGIAPKVYAVSDDCSYALIEYMNGKTLSLEEAKQQIPVAARTMAILHSLPENPFPRKRLMDQFQKIYEELKGHGIAFAQLDEAMAELKKLDEEILNYKIPSVAIHGDMHPRNLFFTGKETLFAVDWEGVSRDDPFYDLIFFSMMNHLDGEEENRLLETYLKRKPFEDEAKRYGLCKKMNFIFLALTCLIQSHFSSLEEKSVLKTDAKPEDWSYYITRWAEKGEHPAQFFYDWGKSCLDRSHRADVV